MIIDFNKNNTSGSGGTADLKNYWTSAQTESAITEATQDFVTSGEVQTQIDDSLSGVTVDLSDYYTSAQTESAIAEATEDFITSADTINKIVLGETLYQDDYYSAMWGTSTSNPLGAKSTVVFSKINGQKIIGAPNEFEIPEYNFELLTSADTQAINADIATLSGIVQTDEQVTAAALVDLDTRIIALSGATSGLNNYVTSGQVATQIENYNYVTSGQVETQITSKNYITSAATQNMVTSTNIRTLLKVTQAEWELLVSGGTVDANTAYYVV